MKQRDFYIGFIEIIIFFLFMQTFEQKLRHIWVLTQPKKGKMAPRNCPDPDLTFL